MNIKEFIKKHEGKIIVGSIVGGAIIGIVLTKKYLGNKMLEIEGQEVLKAFTSKPEAVGRTTEEVVDFILNVAENDKFAIFKESKLYEIVKL